MIATRCLRLSSCRCIADTGVKSVKLPPRSPNLNAYAERFVRSIKESCLDRMILFGEASLRKAVHEFVGHYLKERNHQGLGNRLINPELSERNMGEVGRRQRLVLTCINQSKGAWVSLGEQLPWSIRTALPCRCRP